MNFDLKDMTLDEELIQEAEDDRLTVEYIQNYLPQELKERFTEEELYYFLDVLVDYYTTSGILDATPGQARQDGRFHARGTALGGRGRNGIRRVAGRVRSLLLHSSRREGEEPD